MDCNFARFRYGPTIQTVALYPGIPIDELSNILTTVLPVSGKIIGLQDENGAVVPLTLACRSPNILSGCLSVILATDATSAPVENKTLPESLAPSAPPLSIEEESNVNESISPNFGATPPPFQPSTDPEYDNVLSADDLQQADNTLDELLRFIAGLRVQRVIKKQEADALEELLFNNSSLIFAAYSVAKSASDAEYLTEVCKDIAQSMMSTAGQSACAAQEDVLQCCDRLYIDNKITDNQLLYLRHLVLIRDEDVAQMYDDFRENFDVQRLMLGLFRLANLQPKMKEDASKVQEISQKSQSEPIKNNQNDAANFDRETQKKVDRQRKSGDSKSRPKKENPYRKKVSIEQPSTTEATSAPDGPRESNANQTVMLNTLNGIIALMIRTGDITPIEAALLNHMITSQNEFIFAAYEIFQSDGNVVELQDTLARCAKIEMKKRGLENQKQERKPTSNPSKTNNKSTTAQRNQRTRNVSTQIVSEADDEDSPTSSDDNSQPKIDPSPSNDLEAPQSCDSPTQLSRLLSSLNVTNVWQNTVPTKFVYTVFNATQKRLLSIGQCRALCDLFQAQYDLVRAAWEVFNVQNDTFDFIDTLKRIVRDLTFQDNGNVNLSVPDDEAVDNYEESNYETSSKDIVEVMKDTEIRAKEAREAKSNALAAVAEAKRELLKHSLEILVKQGLVTTQAASNLYERALKGDPLTDAAIEGYAGDRNIMEFLDTLQILANNSPEALEQMLRSAMNSNEEDEVEEYDMEDTQDDDELLEVPDDDADDDNEAEATDDHDDSLFNEVQMELKYFAKEMLARGDIDRDGFNSLLEMITMNDDRVLAAHDVYRDLQDKDDLFDSLLRISRKYHGEKKSSEDGGIEMSELSKSKEEEDANEVEMTQLRNNSRSRRNADESGVELSNLQSRKPESNMSQRSQSPPTVLTADDQKSILVILINAGVITDSQANQILTLIDNSSREIQLIFKQYEQHKDVHTLINSLRMASSEAEEVDEDNEGEQNSEENEDEDFDSTARVGGEIDEDDSELDEDEKESIEMKFLNIIQGMSLSHLETAALRLAIARDDPTIRFALETFRVNRDENILMRTLHDVARQTINETLNEAGYDGVEDDSPNSNNNLDDEGQEEEEEDDDEEEEEEEEEDDDEEEDEDEEDDDGIDENQRSENNAMVSKAARLHIFPILINELQKENVLSSTESKKLLELFQNDDDVINAALDVYDLDSDLSELVDTLQRIVQTSSY